MIEKFSSEVKKQLNYYVYRLVDPRNGQTFYVGKGKGNRVFDHVKAAENNIENFLKDEDEKDEDEISLKYKQIQEIKSLGLDVIHIIHRHNLSEKEAFEVEAALIDCYPGLTNIQSGHNSDYGVNNVETIQNIYSIQEYKEQDNIDYMIIKIRNDRIYECGGNIYEAVRASWRINKKKAEKCKYILCVVNMIVKEVYEVKEWKDAVNNYKSSKSRRYEFIGEKAPNNISELFKNKKIPKTYCEKGKANPIQYHFADKK